jgi:ATP-dependent exoDNAse (exonuclease V) alpha subunit
MPGPKRIEINDQFRQALELMDGTDRHVFVTGKAGTGKSTLLEHFRGVTGKRIAVLAPTGVAALNVNGQTVHSFCRFKPGVTADTVKKARGEGSDLYRNLDAVVIDEISMVRADLLDCVEKFLRLNGRRPRAWFGGTQMIFIGDLYQLPPVVTPQEKGIFAGGYETPYFFSAKVFNEPTFEMEFVELEKVYRQTDAEFVRLLNAFRNGSVTAEDVALLNEKLDPGFTPSDRDFYITLTSTNDLAGLRNREKLDRLGGETWTCRGEVEGEFERSSLPTDELIELKAGAQVMLVNNDRQGRWVNGSIGRVAGFVRTEEAHDRVRVELRDGPTVEVEPCLWELFRYGYDKEADRIYAEPTGSFTQYPLKLAWAVTIHKSQGKTFDRVVVDIGRGTFAHGQLYVALSRCTNFPGLVLRTKVGRQHIRLDRRVIAFLTRFQYRKAEERLPYEEKKALIRKAIRSRGELDIVYLKTDDTKTRRRIRPEAVETMEYRGKTFEGVRAFCHKRGGARTFRIDRMLEVDEVREARH